MIQASIFEAKTSLSRLVKQAQKGELVVITSGRGKTPVARLVGEHAEAKMRLGAMETPGFELTEKFLEPLAEDELELWEGGGK
ncbi:MAG: type II toxin-antitoxin system prevent-host-death family antitoxin [Terracidiphilus sp.]|nr:type II toxin-antitoxin system prevent-host-death family antitoxin [Terracidiphilus sp.]